MRTYACVSAQLPKLLPSGNDTNPQPKTGTRRSMKWLLNCRPKTRTPKPSRSRQYKHTQCT